MKIIQNNASMAENVAKTLKNDMEEVKMEQKVVENVEKVAKTDDLKAQYEALKKDKPELIKKTREVAKSKDKPKPKKEEEVTVMKEWRTPSERILIQVCKELKLAAPERIQAKAGSKSGVGALRVKINGEVVLSVRTNDIVAFIPLSYMEVGRAEIAPYDKVVTKLNGLDEAALKKAMVKALKCKKAPSVWKKEAGFSLAATPAVKKAVAIKETAEQKYKRLNAELAEVKKALKAKPKTKRANVLATVAATAIVPTPETTVA